MTIFKPDGPLLRAMQDLQMLVCLNLLTLLYSIPVVTAGAALAAMHYVLMDRVCDDSRPLFAEYHRRFRQNLKNATAVWMILLGSFAVLYAEYRLIKGEVLPVPGSAALPAVIGMYICGAIFVYAIPLTAKFENTALATLKNASILALTHIPRTVLALILLTVIPYLLFSVTRLLPMFFLLGISFPSYLQALLYMPVLKKMWKGE